MGERVDLAFQGCAHLQASVEHFYKVVATLGQIHTADISAANGVEAAQQQLATQGQDLVYPNSMLLFFGLV